MKEEILLLKGWKKKLINITKDLPKQLKCMKAQLRQVVDYKYKTTWEYDWKSVRISELESSIKVMEEMMKDDKKHQVRNNG